MIAKFATTAAILAAGVLGHAAKPVFVTNTSWKPWYLVTGALDEALIIQSIEEGTGLKTWELPVTPGGVPKGEPFDFFAMLDPEPRPEVRHEIKIPARSTVCIETKELVEGRFHVWFSLGDHHGWEWETNMGKGGHTCLTYTYGWEMIHDGGPMICYAGDAPAGIVAAKEEDAPMVLQIIADDWGQGPMVEAEP